MPQGSWSQFSSRLGQLPPLPALPLRLSPCFVAQRTGDSSRAQAGPPPHLLLWAHWCPLCPVQEVLLP